jgi:hypothetical protein
MEAMVEALELLIPLATPPIPIFIQTLKFK